MTTTAQQGPGNTARVISTLRHADWTNHRSRDAALQVETAEFAADTATVRVCGELDLGTAAPLWAVLRGHLAAGRRFLRLDVSALSFLDATALSGLHDLHDDALAARGTLVVIGVGPMVSKVLHLSGLDAILFVGGPRSGDETRPGHAEAVPQE